jgi:hypothetical protein
MSESPYSADRGAIVGDLAITSGQAPGASVREGMNTWRDTYSSKLWKFRDGEWHQVIEWPPGFTEDDIASLHTLINGLFRRMLTGYDNSENRIRSMQREGATPAAIDWVMGSIAVPYSPEVRERDE